MGVSRRALLAQTALETVLWSAAGLVLVLTRPRLRADRDGVHLRGFFTGWRTIPWDVIEAVEGESRRRTCVLRGGPCGRDGHCQVHDPFYAAQEAVFSTLAAARLADLAARSEGTLPLP